MTLPPGPRASAALQTWAWVARPTDFLRRAQARYGEPFTVRTSWQDAPLVVVSDPAEIKRALAGAELDRWSPGRPIRTHARMQALTLDVIARVVLGAGDDPDLRREVRATLDMTGSLPQLTAMALVR